MADSTISLYDEAELNRLRKLCPSRERAEEVRRIGLSLEGSDASLLLEVTEFLLDARRVLRGGRRDVSGGKNWDSRGPSFD